MSDSNAALAVKVALTDLLTAKLNEMQREPAMAIVDAITQKRAVVEFAVAFPPLVIQCFVVGANGRELLFAGEDPEAGLIFVERDAAAN